MGEVRGQQVPTKEGTSGTVTKASVEPVVIILQEFLTNVVGPPTPPPQKVVDQAGPSAPPFGNVPYQPRWFVLGIARLAFE